MWILIGAGIGLIALALGIYGLYQYFWFEKWDDTDWENFNEPY